MDIILLVLMVTIQMLFLLAAMSYKKFLPSAFAMFFGIIIIIGLITEKFITYGTTVIMLPSYILYFEAFIVLFSVILTIVYILGR